MDKLKRRGSGGVLIAIGLLIVSKLKWVLALLKFSKFGGTIVSLVISLGAYAIFFGWRFAVAIIYLFFVHEMGHLVAAKIKGLKTSPAVFIPFMGAVIGIKEQPKDAATESFVAYGGPLAGLISILPPLILFEWTREPIWALVIMLGAMINLFNLFPVSPLDGGRIVGVLSPHLWLLGLAGIVALAYFFPSPIIILIVIFGIFSWWRRIREDFRIKTIRLEIKVKAEVMDRLAAWKKDLFYSFVAEDGDGPIVNEMMQLHVIREWRGKIAAWQDDIQSMKKWTVPFIQDRLKLKRREGLIRIKEYERLIHFISQIQEQTELDEAIYEIEVEKEKLHDQADHINKYYDAPIKTRLVAFFAYLLLAAVLGMLYLYGYNQLESFMWYD